MLIKLLPVGTTHIAIDPDNIGRLVLNKDEDNVFRVYAFMRDSSVRSVGVFANEAEALCEYNRIIKEINKRRD